MKVIIYQNQDNNVSIVRAASSALVKFTMLEIGKLSIPFGVPFWIVDEDSLPTDQDYRDAWELDFSIAQEPSGYGEKCD